MMTNSGANTLRKPLRFGVLGAANINENAIISPCFTSPEDAVIVALAARDHSRADNYIAKHNLNHCKVFGSYQELLGCGDMDAVYIPLPNGLHFQWTMKALEAGLHVLCEKPFSSNAEEARIMVETAKQKQLVLMEAAHWFYHPFRSRMQEHLACGILGEVSGVYANFHMPGKPALLPETKIGTSAIRYDASLAGGCMMDCGWYALNCIRTLLGRQVPEVTWAEAQKWPHDNEIDEGMKAGLQFAHGVKAELLCSYAGDDSDGFMHPIGASLKGSLKHPLGKMRWDVQVKGSKGTMDAINYGVPHKGNRIIVTSLQGTELINETVDSGGFSTYDLMVLAFCSHVRQVQAGWVTNTEAFANTGMEPVIQMETIDRIYAKAGLKPRMGPAAIISKL